jgi:ureidoacrylate peracid hydrolase
MVRHDTRVFPLEPRQTALLFFDCLNVYLHPADERARAAVDASGVIGRMQRIEAACRSRGVPIVYTQADHRMDGRDFVPRVVDRWMGGQPGEPPRLSLRPVTSGGTPEAEVIAEIAPRDGDYVIKKHRWSAFHQTHLELSLRTASVDTLLLAGGSIEIGIASTAYAARDLDYNLVVLRDVCTTRHRDLEIAFMERVFPIFTRVMTVDDAIGSFSETLA